MTKRRTKNGTKRRTKNGTKRRTKNGTKRRTKNGTKNGTKRRTNNGKQSNKIRNKVGIKKSIKLKGGMLKAAGQSVGKFLSPINRIGKAIGPRIGKFVPEMCKPRSLYRLVIARWKLIPENKDKKWLEDDPNYDPDDDIEFTSCFRSDTAEELDRKILEKFESPKFKDVYDEFEQTYENNNNDQNLEALKEKFDTVPIKLHTRDNNKASDKLEFINQSLNFLKLSKDGDLKSIYKIFIMKNNDALQELIKNTADTNLKDWYTKWKQIFTPSNIKYENSDKIEQIEEIPSFFMSLYNYLTTLKQKIEAIDNTERLELLNTFLSNIDNLIGCIDSTKDDDKIPLKNKLDICESLINAYELTEQKIIDETPMIAVSLGIKPNIEVNNDIRNEVPLPKSALSEKTGKNKKQSVLLPVGYDESLYLQALKDMIVYSSPGKDKKTFITPTNEEVEDILEPTPSLAVFLEEEKRKRKRELLEQSKGGKKTRKSKKHRK